MNRRDSGKINAWAAVATAVAALLATAVVTFLLVQTDDAGPGPVASSAATAQEMVVHKHPQCGCCNAWIEHLESEGFNVATRSETDARKRLEQHDVPLELGACHTAVIDGYVIEGHVPASDVRRLLQERPEAVGLVLPGMPVGSPGMEGSNPETYEVLLLKHDGDTEVFQRHEGEAG